MTQNASRNKKPLKRHFDERGSFTELTGEDWKEIIERT